MFTITGDAATVYWGYLVAATLADWSVEFGVIRARVVDADPYRITQPGLSVMIPNRPPAPAVRRRLVNVRVTDGAFAARLGPKE